jgi:hypothetical protein
MWVVTAFISVKFLFLRTELGPCGISCMGKLSMPGCSSHCLSDTPGSHHSLFITVKKNEIPKSLLEILNKQKIHLYKYQKILSFVYK